MNDILLIRNDVKFLESIKGLFERSFSKEDLDKGAYVLGIKIYRDRSRRLMILSKNAHLDMILKEFKIDQQRRSSWLCYKV